MGASRFNVGGSCFSDGGALFLSRGCTPYGRIGFDGVGVFEKNGRMGGAPPMPPHYGKPWAATFTVDHLATLHFKI